MMLLKMVLVSWAAYSAVAGRLGSIVQVQQLAFMQIFALGADVIFSIALRIGIVLLVLAVLDYIVQRFNIERQLRMSKTEVKEEMKSMEGDPKVKMRRRQIAMQRARDRLKKEVPTADVIITNPTHFAVALKYDAAAMHAPRVVAKGADLMARRIRELAAEHGIPIVERATLARAIYRLVDVGQEIPEQFYAAIAEILAYVYELSGKAKRKAAV
jgi:flagellar biosynthesis protein FlhB